MHFFVSGAGGYNLHPELKPEVQASAQALNEGATSLLKHVGHGFLSVSVHADSMEVVAVDDKAQAIRRFQVPYTNQGNRYVAAAASTVPTSAAVKLPEAAEKR